MCARAAQDQIPIRHGLRAVPQAFDRFHAAREAQRRAEELERGMDDRQAAGYLRRRDHSPRCLDRPGRAGKSGLDRQHRPFENTQAMPTQDDSDLDALEACAIHVLREAHARLRPLAMLWSVGKDSNVLLWLARKAFLGHVPFACALLDTGDEFPEVYALRDDLVRRYDLDCVNVACPPMEATDPGLPPAARAAQRKTLGLRNFIAERDLAGLLLGIRADEQAVRAKEPYASPRDARGAWNPSAQPPELWSHYAMDRPPGGHVRVHPIIDWAERDIWRYVKREGIPVCSLYFARDGQRYRTIGESSITRPIASTAADIDAILAELATTRTPERSGRAMDHESEDAFERLRAGGYM